MHAHELSPDLIALRDGLLRFLDKEVIALHHKHRALLEEPRAIYRDDGRFSDEVLDLIKAVRQASSNAGYYQMCVPEALGGGGMGHLAYYVAWQALYYHCGPRHWLSRYAIAHWAFGPSRLLEKFSNFARDQILPGLMDGSQSMCFGLSEPNAGSDASMIKTQAKAVDNGWRISGRKIWTTNAPTADYCLLFALTEGEEDGPRRNRISAFIVPTSAPGFCVQRIIRLFGHAGGDEAEIALDDVHVEPWQLVGELGEGFQAALYGVSLGRVYNAARAVGYGRWALELALEYAATREAFGQTISNYQGVTFPLAESATQLHAAHLMGINASELLDQGHAAVKELSMAKAYSVQIGLAAVDRAMQTHGGMGFTNEVGLTEAWHALRVINVADGTNEILNRTIAQRLLKGDVSL